MNDSDAKYFVEVGTGSVETLLPLAKQGWQGICIEPVKFYLDQLERVPGVIYENTAICEFEGEVPFYRLCEKALQEHDLPPWANGLGSLSPKHPVIVHHKWEQFVIKETVPCTPLSTLLERHGVTRIDFLKIDTEGYDYNVLRTLDFRIKPALIKIEHFHMPEEHTKACVAFLKERGYLIYGEKEDLYAIC